MTQKRNHAWKCAVALAVVKTSFSFIDTNADGGIDVAEAQMIAIGMNNP